MAISNAHVQEVTSSPSFLNTIFFVYAVVGYSIYKLRSRGRFLSRPPTRATRTPSQDYFHFMPRSALQARINSLQQISSASLQPPLSENAHIGTRRLVSLNLRKWDRRPALVFG